MRLAAKGGLCRGWWGREGVEKASSVCKERVYFVKVWRRIDGILIDTSGRLMADFDGVGSMRPCSSTYDCGGGAPSGHPDVGPRVTRTRRRRYAEGIYYLQIRRTLYLPT